MGMQEALDSYIANVLSSVHTALPGKVVSYDAAKHRAKVKPVPRMLMGNGVKIELPELLDVPVVFPSSGAFDIEFPLATGDGVLLIFQELDISEWKENESTPTASTSSRFNLDSAIAIPGLSPNRQEGRARISVDQNGIVTWSARKIVFDGQLVVHDDMIVRGDVFVGVGDGPGVSLSQHIHPTPTGPSSQPTPTSTIPPEEQ